MDNGMAEWLDAHSADGQIKEDTDHPCAYTGQKFSLVRTHSDGSMDVILRCGHRILLAHDMVQLTSAGAAKLYRQCDSEDAEAELEEEEEEEDG